MITTAQARMHRTLAAALFLAVLVTLTQADVEDEMKFVVQAFYESQNSIDCAKFVSLFADEFAISDPHGSKPVTSKDDLENSCEQGATTFDVIDVRPMDVFVAGDGAAAPFLCRSVLASGCALYFSGTDVFQFDLQSSSTPLIKRVDGYFNATIPEIQSNCKASM